MILNEQLNSSQQAMVDNWAAEKNPQSGKTLHQEGKQFSNHVFGNQDRVAIPINHFDSPNIPDAQVRNHLEKHGYTIKDYRAGIATLHREGQKPRDFSIGNILNRLGASPSLVRRFTNDQTRSVKSLNGLKIIISRHPHDVAGMSTDRGWTSCMTLDTEFPDTLALKKDVQRGTHTAYLVHHDDDEIKNPIARIAMKPFHSIDDQNEKILRPEAKTYGAQSDSFYNSVRDWSEQHFPAKSGHFYRKDPELYDDDHNREFVHARDIETLDRILATHGHDLSLVQSVARVGHKKHLDQLVDHPDEEVRALVASHGHQEHLDKLIHDDSPYVADLVAARGTTAHHHALIDRVETMPASDEKRSAFDGTLEVIASHTKDPAIVKRLKNNSSPWVRRAAAAYHPETHNDLVNDPDSTVRRMVARTSTDHNILHQLLKRNSTESEKDKIAEEIAEKNIPEFNDKLINHSSVNVRRAVIIHDDNNRYTEHGLTDPEWSVRTAAIKNLPHNHSALTDGSLTKDLDNAPFAYTRALAMKQNKRVLDQLVNHHDSHIRMLVAQHGYPDHADKLVNDDDVDVRSAVAESGYKRHRQQLLNDHSSRVRDIARRKLGIRD